MHTLFSCIPILGTVLLLGFLFFFPSRAFSCTMDGLILWYQTILPTLAPFLLLTIFLRKCLPGNHKGLAILGLFCGCPAGAAILAGLIKENRLTVPEGQFFLSFTNNASPVFILHYVSSILLSSPDKALFYWCVCVLSSVLSAFLLCPPRKWKASQKNSPASQPVNRRQSQPAKAAPSVSVRFSSSFGFLDDSITETAAILVKIGGYIILFSILNGMLLLLPFIPDFPKILCSGFLEMTTGLKLLAACPLSPEARTVLSLMLCSFGGLSTLAQTQGVIKGSGLSIHTCLHTRLLQSFLTGLFIFLHLYAVK